MTALSRFWLDLPIARKTLLVIAIPVVPLIVTAALALVSSTASDAALTDTDRAWANRVAEERLFALVLEAETSVRGYLLSADPIHLEQHGRVRADIGSTLASLYANLTDPAMTDRLPRLRQLVGARLQALDDVLAASEVSGLDSPEMVRHVARGEAIMRGVREQILELTARQEAVLDARAARVAASRARTDTIVRAGAAVGVVGGIAAALLFISGITSRVAQATRNMRRVATGEALLAAPAAADEIGTLTAGIERASALLAERDSQLQQRMLELEGLTRELEAFSYSVSHDLRAPLRHIVGFAQMLEKSAGESLSEQQQRYIRTIVRAAGSMGRLIDDLLAFSRTSRTELRRVPVDLNAIVRDVREAVEAEAAPRRIRWVVHTLPRVHGDWALLRVVFDNLLSNAVKYTRPNADAEIEVGSRRDGDLWEVYVRDNGVGFDMRYRDKLFGVFQRLHSSDDFEGTGIGLATVRRIVTRHGGRAWGEGRPGQGATFSITLPAAQEPMAA